MPSLSPLEFRECVIDGPNFRKALTKHEKELKYANKRTKCVYESVKNVFDAMGNLNIAMLELAESLENFSISPQSIDQLQTGLSTNGSRRGTNCSNESNSSTELSDTDDEIKMDYALKFYARLIRCVEEARHTMIKPNKEVILKEISELREFWLAGHKTNSKSFAKETNTFCQALEKYVAIKPKDYVEAADVRMHEDRQFYLSRAFEYVANITEAEELKKFKFIQTISVLVKMLSNFYHQACEQIKDSSAEISQILEAAQRSSENFKQIKDETKALTEKLLQTPWEQIQSSDSASIREGYLFVLTKKAVATTWVKTFCYYNRDSKLLQMTPYSQMRDSENTTEMYTVVKCVTRPHDSIDRRCCFAVEVDNKSAPIIMQAQSLADLHEWILILDGKEPIHTGHMSYIADVSVTSLNNHTYQFVRQLIEAIEDDGLQMEGIYRKCGALSQVHEVVKKGLSSNGITNSSLSQYNVCVLCGALKYFIRNLDESLMTFDLYDSFLDVIKRSPQNRLGDLSNLLHRLPDINADTLTILIQHLSKVAQNSAKNSMNADNLGIVFAPSLFRPKNETVAAIMTTRFTSSIVTLMIQHCDQLFPLNETKLRNNNNAEPDNHNNEKSIKTLAATAARTPSIIVNDQQTRNESIHSEKRRDSFGLLHNDKNYTNNCISDNKGHIVPNNSNNVKLRLHPMGEHSVAPSERNSAALAINYNQNLSFTPVINDALFGSVIRNKCSQSYSSSSSSVDNVVVPGSVDGGDDDDAHHHRQQHNVDIVNDDKCQSDLNTPTDGRQCKQLICDPTNYSSKRVMAPPRPVALPAPRTNGSVKRFAPQPIGIPMNNRSILVKSHSVVSAKPDSVIETGTNQIDVNTTNSYCDGSSTSVKQERIKCCHSSPDKQEPNNNNSKTRSTILDNSPQHQINANNTNAYKR